VFLSVFIHVIRGSFFSLYFEADMNIPPDRLRPLIREIFLGAGCEPEEADLVSDHLIRANLAGHDSHGVIRTPIYVTWLREGKVFANRKIQVLFENESLALVDGQLGLGQSIGMQAVSLGIARCQRQGVSMIALRNSGHLGRIGHWAEQATAAGLVSLHFVNNSGLGMHMVPAGGKDRRLSLNPITMGFPVRGAAPVVLDIAAAATAEGKLKVARNKGARVPDGWILDSQGRPTNDPRDFYDPPGGAILPFGGHKGYGLAFMAELLAGALTGGGCSREGRTRLEQNMLSIFIDPARLRGQDELSAEIQSYIAFVKSSRPLEPGGEVLVPGDIEERNRVERSRAGIEVDETTWRQIVATARSCQVEEEWLAVGEPR
jgi:uncharacterized oxidoreductase